MKVRRSFGGIIHRSMGFDPLGQPEQARRNRRVLTKRVVLISKENIYQFRDKTVTCVEHKLPYLCRLSLRCKLALTLSIEEIKWAVCYSYYMLL